MSLQRRVDHFNTAYRNPRAVQPKMIGHRAHAADPARLRGIPAIGPNAPGAQRGTRPDHAARIAGKRITSQDIDA